MLFTRKTIVFPIHNEGQILPRLFGVLDAARANNSALRFVFLENGSTDDSVAQLRAYAKTHGYAEVFSFAKAGRGAALRTYIEQHATEPFVYMDADLPVDFSDVEKIFLELDAGKPVVVASRWVQGSSVAWTWLRKSISRSYNFCVRLFLGSRMRDHQCGCKGFAPSAVRPLLANVSDNGWFFDTELLLVAQQAGIQPVEVPVAWRDGFFGKQRKSRVILTKDIPYFFRQLWRMWRRKHSSNL